jgi:selenocysteine lyase/cysteine desulfurase
MTVHGILPLTGTTVLPSVVGRGQVQVNTAKGAARVVALNNAATTPPFEATLAAVNEFMSTYGAVHRGAGPLARLTCDAVHAALETIREFLGCRPDQSLLFTSNTSTAINLLARLMPFTAEDIVLTSELEHTSNNLPWKFNTKATVVEARAFDDGSLDYDHLDELARRYRGRVRLIAISGASNLTGYVPSLERLRAAADSAGDAMLFVDAAQLAPHRPISMRHQGIDALALSGHKLYAPFGAAVLALPSRLLDRAPPDPGGGSIDMLSEEGVLWTRPTARHQIGTWNAVGIVAIAASCRSLEAAGWEAILRHEQRLVERAAPRLAAIQNVRVHVAPDRLMKERRIGTIPFSVGQWPAALVSAALEHEHGIETRAGTICNHRLVRRWFGVDDDEQRNIEARIAGGNCLASYAVCRASIGIHNTEQDIDRLVTAVTEVARSGPRLSYRPSPADESFEPDWLARSIVNEGWRR